MQSSFDRKKEFNQILAQKLCLVFLDEHESKVFVQAFPFFCTSNGMQDVLRH